MPGQGHSHGHGNGHAHGHSHGFGGADTEHNRRRVGLAAAVIGCFMVAEVVGGIISGSLALLADAGHMVSDFASLLMAWYAFRIAKRPPTKAMSYGVDRFQILAAFANGLMLVFLCIWISIEAVLRFLDPVEVLSGTMMIVAIIGLVANIVAFLVLSGANRENLNVRGAMIHVVGDMLGSVAAIVAAWVIMMTGWMTIDPLLSLLVAAIILRSAYYLVRESGYILLQGTPVDIDTDEVERDLAANVEGLTEVHHLHAWSITQARMIATLHAKIVDTAPPDRVIRDSKVRLRERFGIHHSTVEIEYAECADAPAVSAHGA